MSEQKFAEFRERAEIVVGPVDPDLLLQRGRRLRRRRQLAPVAAVAVIAALGYGIVTADGGDPQSDELPPVTPPSASSAPLLDNVEEVKKGVTYSLDYVRDGEADATLTVFGDGWLVGGSGIYKAEARSAVSIGLDVYSGVIVDQCNPGERAESVAGAVRQLSRIAGTVTVAPRRETVMGLPARHLQLSIPVDVACTNGATPTGSNLNSVWDGPTDPTVTVDIWLVQQDGYLILLTKSVRGTPSVDTRIEWNRTMDSLRFTE